MAGHAFEFLTDACGECLAPMAMHRESYQPDHVPVWVGEDEQECACGAARRIADDPTTDPLEHGQRPDHPFFLMCGFCGLVYGDHDEDGPDEDEDVGVPSAAVEAAKLGAFAAYLEPDPDRVWVVSEQVPPPRR